MSCEPVVQNLPAAPSKYHHQMRNEIAMPKTRMSQRLATSPPGSPCPAHDRNDCFAQQNQREKSALQ